MKISNLTKEIKGLDGYPNSLRRHLVRGFKGSAVLFVIQRLFTFLLAVVLGRILGAEGFGVYSTAMAVILLTGTLVTNGIPRVMLRFVPLYSVEKEWGLLRGMMIGINRVSIVASISLITVLGVGAVIFSSSYDESSLYVFWIGLVLIPLVGISNLRSEVVRGLHHILAARMPEVVKSGLVLLIILLFWALSSDTALSPSHAMTAQVIAAGIALIVSSVIFYRYQPKEIKGIKPNYDMRKWLRSIGPLTLVSAFGIIAAQTDIIMLSAIKGAEPAGIYRIAERL